AHREPADDGALCTGGVERATEVRDERLRRVGGGIVGCAAARMSAGVVADGAPSGAQGASLRAEVARAAGKAVREQDGRTVAVHLDVERRLRRGHDATCAAAVSSRARSASRWPSSALPARTSATPYPSCPLAQRATSSRVAP